MLAPAGLNFDVRRVPIEGLYGPSELELIKITVEPFNLARGVLIPEEGLLCELLVRGGALIVWVWL